MALLRQRSPEHLYRVTNDPYRTFVTGRLTLGHQQFQTLAGPLNPYFVALLFDQHGNLEDIVTVDRSTAPQLDSGAPIPIGDEGILPSSFVRWLGQMSYLPAPIAVKRFSLPDFELSIEDYPTYFDEVLADLVAYPADEGAFVQTDIERWLREGQFILNWDRDYWLDSSGEVVAT